MSQQHTREPWEEKVREDFYKEKCHYEDGYHHEIYENNPEDVADWWLSKIPHLLEEQLRGYREKVEEMRYRGEYHGYRVVENPKDGVSEISGSLGASFLKYDTEKLYSPLIRKENNMKKITSALIISLFIFPVLSRAQVVTVRSQPSIELIKQSIIKLLLEEPHRE